MSKKVILGWSLQIVGTALWIYGYFATGNPTIINWPAIAPWWIADYLPTAETEIGMAFIVAGIIPLYWPAPGADR